MCLSEASWTIGLPPFKRHVHRLYVAHALYKTSTAIFEV